MTADLTAACADITAGRVTSEQLLDVSIAAAHAPANRHSFIRLFEASARAAARSVDLQHAAGIRLPALAGLAVSVKDLFDVQGQPTTAGSIVLNDSPPALMDCPVVSRLRVAGAALVGHTNMSEFAFSGVGLNPHHGTPANPVTAALDPAPRIPGGSSSGAAASVATGASWAALGSDTGGSIRIPAALQGLVGFKNTARLTPTDGAVPLSTTLDTACAITRSVRDAALLHEVLCGRHMRLPARPIRGLRLAIATTWMLDGLDAHVASVFQRTLNDLRCAGAQVDDIALHELAELRAMQSTGGFPAAESWAWHRKLLAEREADYDPRVAARIRRGEQISAADYIELIHLRRDWIARMNARIEPYDAVLSPTVPMVAPTIESLQASDALFFRVNALLLRNPSAINMLDGCALSLPCHRAGEMPVGLMIWGAAMTDERVLAASLAIESALASGTR